MACFLLVSLLLRMIFNGIYLPPALCDFSLHKNLNSSNKLDSQPHSPALFIQFKRLETIADKPPATATHQNLSSSSSAHETSYFTQPPPAIQLPQSQAEQTPDQQPQMSKDNSNEPLKRQNSFNSRAKSAIGELEVALSFQAEAVHRKLSRRNSGHSRSGASETVDLKMPGEELAESTAFLLPTVHKGSFVIPNKSTPSPEVQASNPGSLQDPTPQRAYSNRPSQTSHNGLPILNHVAQQPMNVSGAAGQPQHDYSNLSTPSVWRSARTQAAAKVEALSSNGMDEIEIPAFLRKQAD